MDDVPHPQRIPGVDGVRGLPGVLVVQEPRLDHLHPADSPTLAGQRLPQLRKHRQGHVDRDPSTSAPAPASSIRSHRATCAGSRFSRPAPATWSSRYPASTAQPRAAMAAAVVVTRAISGKTRATANSCMTASTLLVASSATTTA